MNNIKHIVPNIKNGVKYGFGIGFCSSFIVPNNICVKKYTNEKKTSHLSSKTIGLIFPFIGGFVGASSVLCFPLLFANYMVNGTYFDKLYDRIQEKYSIQVERYHQYDGNDNKYAYPSLICIEIKETVKYDKLGKNE